MNKKYWILIGVSLLLAGLAWWLFSATRPKNIAAALKVVQAHMGSIEVKVSTSGTVEPQNRLEVKPPIAGRVEKMLVKEGQAVQKGETLAWLSSTERAALLDAARTQGTQAMDYWENVYKTTPIISPITGTVIVATVEPGQTVQATDAVVVLSDRLIVKAQVDETDIGKIKVGQSATISLDAYPDIHVEAKVDHIAYESTVVSNVTMYNVDVLPVKVPSVFRSGMSANVDVTLFSKNNILLLPREAITQDKKRSFVYLEAEAGAPFKRRPVQTGLSNDEFTEIVSGLAQEDRVVIVPPDYALAKEEKTTRNPFMPNRRRSGAGGGGHH